MLLPLRLELCSLHYDYTLLYIIYRTTDDRQQTIDNGQQTAEEGQRSENSPQYIFMADIWRPRHPSDARYIWLPIGFEDGKPVIRWRDEWELFSQKTHI